MRIAVPEESPFRLHRCAVPTEYVRHNDRTLVFVGMAGVVNMGTYSQLFALGGVAWLVGRLNPRPLKQQSMEEIEGFVAQQSVWPASRYLNAGISQPISFLYEGMPLFDTLMKDLGLNPNRKKGWWSELFEGYCASDYRGAVEEWMAKEGLGESQRVY